MGSEGKGGAGGLDQTKNPYPQRIQNGKSRDRVAGIGKGIVQHL